jgi:hypothetical protein
MNRKLSQSRSANARSLILLFLACLLLGAAGAARAGVGDECVEAPVYGGINALPPVTSTIFPSTNGDAVVNDMTCLLGQGPVVVIGSWDHPTPYTPKPGENPCVGEPTMKIAYPMDLPTDKCYCWKHWVSRVDLHPNSARNFACGDGRFELTQWTDLVCGRSGTAIDPKGERKALFTKKCCRDSPPQIWSQILNFSGCAPK